ncbi:unnamed protein product [Chrysoparadoxa australica]
MERANGGPHRGGKPPLMGKPSLVPRVGQGKPPVSQLASSKRGRGGARKGGTGRMSKGSGKKANHGNIDDDPNKNDDEHPFKEKSVLVVHFARRNKDMFADVIERASISAEANNPNPAMRYKYYVHYHGLNRRMDEWIGSDRIVMLPSQARAALAAREEAKAREKKEALLFDLEGGPKTRRQKRKIGEPEDEPEAGGIEDHDEHEGMDQASLKEHEEVTKVKNINFIEFGKYRMECWYFSPFPKEYYPDGYVECLYFCEYSMRFFRTKEELLRFQRVNSPPRHPPGNEIYRRGSLSMFEVDGADQRIYCQDLCYMAKLFLDHKTLYYDVDPFLFYILCEQDEKGFHPVGYYSKEKYSDLGYNLACIMTFPCHQRKGYGRVLISFSYELSKKEEKVGSPEKPLSDLGAVSYRSYWSSVIIQHLLKFEGSHLSIMDICKATSIMVDDVSNTLHFLGLLKHFNGNNLLTLPKPLLAQLGKKYPLKEPVVDASLLHWAPLVVDQKKDKFSIRSKRPPDHNTNGGGI